MHLDRREFLRMSAIGSALAALGAAPPTVTTRNGMPYRTLGKTGEQVSLLCVGGYHMGMKSMSEAESIRLVRTAVDEGVNFLDNAWMYHDGASEERMGKALKDGYRDRVFLMTKHYDPERSAVTTRKQLEDSLRRLDVDVIDLWQVHQIETTADPGKVYANGVLEVMEQAREEGKVRYIGFTGHSRPEFHADMIDRGYGWDTVQMPLNLFDHHWTSFGKQVLPKALAKDIGVIGMKSLGGSPGQLANVAKTYTVEECLHFAMNLPVASVVSGMTSVDQLERNIAAAKSFTPLTEEELAEILARGAEPAQGGRFEPFKQKTPKPE
jgi:uncharacterized protein